MNRQIYHDCCTKKVPTFWKVCGFSIICFTGPPFPLVYFYQMYLSLIRPINLTFKIFVSAPHTILNGIALSISLWLCGMGGIVKIENQVKKSTLPGLYQKYKRAFDPISPLICNKFPFAGNIEFVERSLTRQYLQLFKASSQGGPGTELFMISTYSQWTSPGKYGDLVIWLPFERMWPLRWSEYQLMNIFRTMGKAVWMTPSKCHPLAVVVDVL